MTFRVQRILLLFFQWLFGFSKLTNLFGYTKYLNLNLVSYDPD